MQQCDFSSSIRNGRSIVRAGSATFSMVVLLALTGVLATHGASAITINNGLIVGEPSTGPATTLYNAGDQVVVDGGVIVGLGQASGAAITGKLTIDGTNTSLAVNSGNILIGSQGGTGTLIVSNNASVTANSANLVLGDISGGVVSQGSMEISGGGSVTSATGTLHNATALITGANSSWTTGNLNIATDASASMSIMNGGHVTTNGDATIGEMPVAATPTSLVSGTVTVDGAGSKWAVSGELLVGSRHGSGQYGQVGTLLIQNGGVVDADTFLSLGTIASSQGQHLSSVTVDGVGSKLNVTGDLGLAFTSTMTVSNGGVVNSAGGGILQSTTSVLVTDAGSQWNMTGTIEQEGTLTVAKGGAVSVAQKIELDSTSSVLNIGAAAGQTAVAAGTVTTPSIVNEGGKIVFNHTSSNFTLGAAISGTGTVDAYSGTTVLTGANTYSGATTLYGGTLRAGGTNVFSAASAHDVRSGATLDLAGYDQTVDTLTNAGTIALNQMIGSTGPAQQIGGGNSAPGTVLTVHNYVGSGGSLVFNTVLGDSNSATDRLVIDGGSATGSTNVIVNNYGGLGAQTAGDGILLVSAINGGTTGANAFSLQGGYIAAGAYDYTLVRGGAAAGTGDNWYLTSNLIVPVTQPSGGSDPTGRIVGTPANSATANGTNKRAYRPLDDGGAYLGGQVRDGATYLVIPNYRAEASLAAAMTPLAIEYGFAMVDTLHQRVGDSFIHPMAPVYEDRVIRDARGNRTVTRVAATPRTDLTYFGGWARLMGDKGIHDNKNFLKYGPDYNYTLGGIQAGFDGFAREQAGTLDKVGIYVGYGQVSSNVKGVLRNKAGDVDMNGLSVGGYWTHKTAQGWYTDTVVQGTWYSTDATSVRGLKLKPDGFGILGSLEGGYAFKFGEGVSFEPQAQLAYQNLTFDNTQDPFGQFSWANTNTWRGRLGARLAKEWNAGDLSRPVPVTAWLRANLWHEFAGKGNVTISNAYGYNPATLSSALGGTWGEIGAGVTGQVTEQLSVFTTAGYSHSLDNKGREAWDGRVGATLKW